MEACEFREGDSCKVAAKWAGLEVVPVTDAACDVCRSCDKPKEVNRVTASLAASHARRTGHPRYEAIQLSALPFITQIGVAEKVTRYAKSSTNWVSSGAPQRSDEETQRTFQICLECDHHKAGACDVCGCAVGTGSGLVHKNRRASEHCPMGKW